MGDSARRQMEPEEVLLWNLDQEDRYELVNGVPVKMMAGATEYHDQIVMNVFMALGTQLRGKPCRVTSADIAIRTKIDGFRRADAMVTCNPPPPARMRSKPPNRAWSSRCFRNTIPASPGNANSRSTAAARA